MGCRSAFVWGSEIPARIFRGDLRDHRSAQSIHSNIFYVLSDCSLSFDIRQHPRNWVNSVRISSVVKGFGMASPKGDITLPLHPNKQRDKRPFISVCEFQDPWRRAAQGRTPRLPAGRGWMKGGGSPIPSPSKRSYQRYERQPANLLPGTGKAGGRRDPPRGITE